MFSLMKCILQCNLAMYPGIVSILSKYKLSDYLNTFMKSNKFPKNYSWKQIVKKVVTHTEQMVKENLLNDIEFLRFKNIYSINMHNTYLKSAKTSKDIE